VTKVIDSVAFGDMNRVLQEIKYDRMTLQCKVERETYFASFYAGHKLDKDQMVIDLEAKTQKSVDYIYLLHEEEKKKASKKDGK
jgi:hypothetical protein